MERIVLAVRRVGSLTGSAVATKTSMEGRSDFAVGLDGDGDSNFCLRMERSVARLMGETLGS
ncbi:hypothetical protein MA16_Dca010920 [Dendrobium catenatum]|uniref:Uncharacterized protein n=1 Tax=Dendrobium catenatum TaxID=906689 RepID=A0A2I0WVL0_9ASPA|nr:hypothetical protein MA16_Dca010920 [Dendrobium catenatum]